MLSPAGGISKLTLDEAVRSNVPPEDQAIGPRHREGEDSETDQRDCDQQPTIRAFRDRDEREQLLDREKIRKGRQPYERKTAQRDHHLGPAHAMSEPAHPSQIGLALQDHDDDPQSQDQMGLDEGVCQQKKCRSGIGTHTNPENHESE